MPAGPRLLLVTRNLPPLLGGMERLNQHLLAELARNFEVEVCGPSVSGGLVPPGVVFRGAPLRPLPAFLAGSMVNALAAAARRKPALVLAGSGLTTPLALSAARLCGARAAAYLHGLDIAVDHPLYQRLWVRRFRRLDLVLVNSRSTAALAEAAGVDPGRIRVVHPGVEMPPWNPALGLDFRRRFDLGTRPLLLSVGRLTQRKGLAEFIREAMPSLVARCPEVYLAIIGDEAANALKGGPAGQRQRIATLVRELGLERNVGLLGPQDDAMLRAAFFAARALVFPVLDLPGDTEGFGMVAVEAAAHGLATVAFAVGGVRDAVSDPESGTLLPPGDYVAMIRCLGDLLQGEEPQESARLRRREFASRFEWQLFGETARALCREAIGG
jgi:phosphatidyl-myo-inositol dimannoside synthase